jgi:hypothetical protein
LDDMKAALHEAEVLEQQVANTVAVAAAKSDAQAVGVWVVFAW